MKKSFTTIFLFVLIILIVNIAGTHASAFGQLQKQTAGQNCFDEGCSGVEGNYPVNSIQDKKLGEDTVFNEFVAGLRTAGTNFFSNWPTLKKKLWQPLFARFKETNTGEIPTEG